MDRRTVVSSVLAGLALPALAARREPTIGGPCEGCDWVFDGQPAKLASRARIAPVAEAGAPMVIEGVVSSARGLPARGVVVYAYHTNQAGLYPPAGNRHGRLRGWAITDAQGHYRFDTIRPGAYPGRNVAEHVHMHVIEPGVGTYYIDNLEFEDDPLNPRRRGAERGGNGLMLPQRRDGVWQARRDIVLGRNIPGYS
ncbi:MAG: dioxygenase family protein [Steroidobacteraceae bacterium]|jgi:protocatechuate 3,4-dioxygenase beta subunit|nr:dioxygenase family protein [Steroidobacteraceae bacterium]